MERFILRNIEPEFKQTFLNNTIQRASRTSFLKLEDVTDLDELWMEGKCCDNTETQQMIQFRLKRARNRDTAHADSTTWSIDSR